MRILLNGVGRIGKAILRIALQQKTFDIVAINELNSNVKNIAYSINYDSTYGRLEDTFTASKSYIENSTSKIEILNFESLQEIDFKAYNIDYVIDASGSVTNIEELKNLHVKTIFLTHPNSDADVNVILGVNTQELTSSEHKIISTSSCNATALLPIIKLIDDNFEIECGEITTIHPLLNHQKTLDSGCIGSQNRDVECNFEFGRSATQNIIPSQTTTIKACSYIMPHINAEIISSSSFRVPTQTVGVIDVTLFVNNTCKKETLLELCHSYEKKQSFDVLLNNSEALVSSDFIAQRFTTILDHRFTDVKMDKMIKLSIWYDNEWGYASKVIDIVSEYHRNNS
ncbi:MAG: glyceraldehyde 3-phosphate dehydrogenase NAD-binding domain-containing protein [Campylobacterota bacterium]|nr:glyceraldehyde 3-phosphate dehydrogenase NAD-binding domain-containing protein [Campylobacterota bacterium]